MIPAAGKQFAIIGGSVLETDFNSTVFLFYIPDKMEAAAAGITSHRASTGATNTATSAESQNTAAATAKTSSTGSESGQTSTAASSTANAKAAVGSTSASSAAPGVCLI